MYRYIINVYRYTLLKKWQWAKCTGTPKMCTGTPDQEMAVVKVYRYTINVYQYTCMRSAGIEQNCDPNAGAYLSIILEHEMTWERSIKGRGYMEKAAFDF